MPWRQRPGWSQRRFAPMPTTSRRRKPPDLSTSRARRNENHCLNPASKGAKSFLQAMFVRPSASRFKGPSSTFGKPTGAVRTTTPVTGCAATSLPMEPANTVLRPSCRASIRTHASFPRASPGAQSPGSHHATLLSRRAGKQKRFHLQCQTRRRPRQLSRRQDCQLRLRIGSRLERNQRSRKIN